MTKVSIRDIQRATCRHFKIGRRDMLSKSRIPHIVEPRHIAMYLARKVAQQTYPVIAREFKRSDHCCVWWAVNKIEFRAQGGCNWTLDSLASIKTALGEDAERGKVAAMKRRSA